jgi:hypothetical protein
MHLLAGNRPFDQLGPKALSKHLGDTVVRPRGKFFDSFQYNGTVYVVGTLGEQIDQLDIARLRALTVAMTPS